MSGPGPECGLFPNAMAYARWGDGPKTLLLIPGGPGNALPTGWLLKATAGPMLQLLDDGFSIWVVTRKRNMPDGHTIEDMAADYGELVSAEFGGRVDVVMGVSYGGLIAQYLAASHADRFSHLVVALAACEVRRAQVEVEFALRMSEGRTVDAWSIMIANLYPELPFPWMARAAGRVVARVTAGSEHEHFSRDIMTEARAEVAFDSRPILPTIEVPILLLNGGDDTYFPLEVIEETAALIPDCTSRIYDGKSHAAAAADKRLATDVAAFAGRP